MFHTIKILIYKRRAICMRVEEIRNSPHFIKGGK